MAKTGTSGVCGALTLKAKNVTVLLFVNKQRQKSCFYGWSSYIMKNEFVLKFIFLIFFAGKKKKRLSVLFAGAEPSTGMRGFRCWRTAS
jgi:hypothetical protein